MTDANDRRREPKGIPTGGRFAKENGGGSDASDLERAEEPVRIPDKDHIVDTPASRAALLDMARAMSSWNGECDWSDASDPEETMAMFGFDPAPAVELADAVANGDYQPTKEYVRYDGYGNIESVDEADLKARAADEADDIRRYLEDTPEVRDALDADTLKGVGVGEPEALLQAAREGNGWDGAFDWADAAEDIESLSGVYGSGRYDAQWIADRAFFGNYEPGHDYIRFDGYGNFESVDESDLERDAWDYREEILDAVRGERGNMDGTWAADMDGALSRLDVLEED